MEPVSNAVEPGFDDLITRILARFASGTSAQVASHIETSLREIAEFVGADYAHVVRTSDDQSHWSVAYEWCSPCAPSRLADHQDVPMGTWSWIEQVLLDGKVLRMNRLADLPSEASQTGEQFKSVNFQSTLQVPTRAPGGLVNGCIALSTIVREVTWAESDTRRLRLVGEAISNALERARAELELRDSERRYRATFDQAPAGILNIARDGRLLAANQHFCQLLGYRHEQLIYRNYWDLIHPDDLLPTTQLFERLTEDRGAHVSLENRYLRQNGDVMWGNLTLSLLSEEDTDADVFVAMIEDLTLRRQAEETTGLLSELRRSEAALRAAREELELKVQELTERLRAENTYLQAELVSSLGFDEIIGASEPLRSALTQIEHVANTDASVLLLGETGTGKELLARAIHQRSPRKHRPLVKVNLAALSSTLIESELFGHVKGAFTGAVANKIGRFQLADGGTLFLDEVGELDPDLQTKLLRVLQEGEFERIGSPNTCKVDVRIVAATNRDLRHAMETNKFRPDLYYRLAVFPIEVPPLRLRRDDIPLLLWHFINKKQGRLDRTIKRVPESVLHTLIEYDWPGNIRELENVVERAMILSTGTTLSLCEPLTRRPRSPGLEPNHGRQDTTRATILAALQACRWKVKGAGNAAERLGLKPSTLRYRMKTLGIQRPAQLED